MPDPADICAAMDRDARPRKNVVGSAGLHSG